MTGSGRVATLVGRAGLAVLFTTAGVMHVLDPAFFHPQVPSFLPAADALIRAVGVLFLVGGVGLLGPAPVRRWAAPAMLGLLVAVWSGNWWGAIQPGSYVSAGAPDALDWVRVPFQLVFLAAVYAVNRDVLPPAGSLRARLPGRPPARRPEPTPRPLLPDPSPRQAVPPLGSSPVRTEQ